MEVKPGYKQTEVGVIPEDWKVEPFQSLAHIERGKFTARPRNDPKYYGGEIPFIQTGDVTNSSGWIKTYSQTLNQEGLKVSKLTAVQISQDGTGERPESLGDLRVWCPAGC